MEFSELLVRGSVIKPLQRSSGKMIVHIGGDTETVRGHILTFQLQGSIFNEYIKFTGPVCSEEDFLSTLDLLPNINQQRVCIWFHNLSFDLPALFPKRLRHFYNREFDFESNGWRINGVYDNLHFCTLTKGKKFVRLLDTLAYFKTALSELGKIFTPDMPKLPTPEGLGDYAFTEEDTDFVKYATRDTFISQAAGQFIGDMHERYEIDPCVSAPHMAGRIFRRHFLKTPIPLPPRFIMYPALNSYHGGKNNFVGKPGLYRNVRTLDIKSAYPFAMRLLPSFSSLANYKKLVMKGKPSCVPSMGIYKVDGYAHETDYPIFYTHSFAPIRGRDFEKLWVTGWELNQALDTGLVRIDSLEGYYYDVTQDKEPSPFAAYVDHFYEMKETAQTKAERNFYKLLLNSLYGKFVETRKSSEACNMIYDVDSGEHYEENILKGGTLFHPFIASMITGHTRSYIHKLETNFKAIHTATDGIMTQQKPRDLSPLLGGLDIEADGDVLIFRNKLYLFYTKDESKAYINRNTGEPLKSILFPNTYIQKFGLHGYFGNPTQLEEMYKTGNYNYEFTKVNKLRESLRRNLQVNEFVKQRRILNIEGLTNGKTKTRRKNFSF